jgi:hypothetical protein
MSSAKSAQLAPMRIRVSTVALTCHKVGVAGTLLAFPLGLLSRTAGEATFAGGVATVLVAGAAWHAADKREMARETLAIRRELARPKRAIRIRPGARRTITVGDGITLSYQEKSHISY